MVTAGVANSTTITVSYQVAEPLDDGFATSTTNQSTTYSALLRIGDNNRYSLPFMRSAMRFTNIQVPHYARINSAHLKIHTYQYSSERDYFKGAVRGIIQAEAAGNPPNFSYSNRYIGTIVPTNAGVNWDHKLAWEPAIWYTSPDISVVLQEVVDRPDFSLGNAVVIIYSTREITHKYRAFYSADNPHTYAPKLEITYEYYNISGYVTTATATPIEGAFIDAGAAIEGDVTDASGYYELKVPPGWSGTVTPSKTDWGFSPANQTYSSVGSDQTNQDYTAFQPVISGYVRDGGSTGIEGVSVLADNGGGSDTTDSSGFYEITVPYEWSGTVAVSKAGWNIIPSSRSYSNVISDQINQDYIAFRPTISGIITAYGGPLAGVTLTGNNNGGVTTTDANGIYHITVPYGWSGSITPSKPQYTFAPAQTTYNNVTADTNLQNYTAILPPVIISGYVNDNSNSPVSDVNIEATDLPETKTDSSGYYQITAPYNWSGTVTATKTDYLITPDSIDFTDIHSDQTNQNFSAFQPTISGFVRDANSNPVAAVNISTDNGGGSDTSDPNGYYEVTVPYNWSGMATANRLGWEITPPNRIYSNIIADQVDQDFLATNIGITVKPDGTGDFATIQAAIDAAVNWDVVVLQPGTFTGDGNRDIDFLGKAITVRGATGDPNDCIIDCQGTEADPHRGFKFVSGEDSNSVLEAITITNGYGPREIIHAKSISVGGAIYCTSNPTIYNCIISNNSASNDGGGIYNDFGGPIIDNCIVVENSAHWGGGIYNYFGNPTISHCAVKHNSAAFPGGGFYNYLSNAIIYNCTISYNSAGSGGGFYNYRGDLIISNCIISYNLADFGSGFYHSYCDPIIKGCVISNNSANFSGGGFLNYSSSPGINNCIISNNTAEYNGGGINNNSSSPVISICAISGNSAREGGGIYNYSSSPNISNCTFSNNSGSNYGSGSGIHNYYNSNPSISNCTISNNSSGYLGGGIVGSSIGSHSSINNCIIWGNQPTQIRGNATVKYSDIQGGYTGVGNIDADPCFADPDANDFHLTGVSLCIDSGDPNYTPDVNETDIDGDPRVIIRIDMGADEVYSSTSALLVVIPGTLDFEAQGLSSAPQPQYVSIRNYGVGVLNWQIPEPNDCDWLSVFPTTGQVNAGESSNVEITVNLNMAGYGTHNCQLLVSSPDAENSPQVVTVNLEVLGPQIGVNKDYFYFTAYGKNDTSVAGQELIITNTGFDTLNWHIEVTDCNWLSVSPLAGQVTDGNSVVAITVDPSKAPAYGYNYATINIIDENASNSPQAVMVRLEVYGPSIYVNPPRGLYIYAESNTKVEGTFEIINLGYDILHWNIETPNDCNWLTSVEPLSGEFAAGESDIVTVTVDANGLENNDYHTQLLIHSAECDSKTVSLSLIVYTPSEIHVPQDYNTIQAAIDAALEGDIIIVHPGKYAGFNDSKSALTIRSIEPENPAVVAATIIESRGYVYGDRTVINGLSFIYNPVVPNQFDDGICIPISSDVQIKNCRALDFPGAGIYVSGQYPTATIRDCVISNNGYIGDDAPGGINIRGYANIENCLITNNFGGGILVMKPFRLGGIKLYIHNSTIADNFSDITKTSGRGITSDDYYLGLTLSLQNSITSNAVGPNDVEIFIGTADNPENINLDIAYSNVRGGLAAVSTPIGANVVWGQGNIDADPCFADPCNSDYHLKSEGWRWDAQRKVWTWDDVTSRCIDAGNPGSLLADEPITIPDDPNNEWGENLRINMGAYGGTTEASIPPYDWALLADLTNDGVVNLEDFAGQAKDWLESESEQPGDLDRSGTVNINDLAMFVEDWLKQTSWSE